MNPFRVLLALCFGLLVCASAGFARGSLSTWPHANNPILAAQAAACTLDVVLVTFRDTTASDTANHRSYDYHDYDRPHGEANGELTGRSYRRGDFLRMLAGGYQGVDSFVGSDVTVANGSEQLPQVFGSVRAYFDAVSNGAFQLHVRMVNPVAAGTGDFPRWVELPASKEHYAERTMVGDAFWDAAYEATLDSLSSSVAAWNTGISLPHHDSTATYPVSRLLRRKILFLYSGPFFNNTDSPLHPRVDVVTEENPTAPDEVGYRYVMSERQGFDNNDHQVDRFAGIGTHAHEIGHLLGLNHGEGYWADPDGRNRYGNRAAGPVEDNQANQLGWTLMQGGGDQGPVDRDPDGYYVAYHSCPNPINPFYLRDLGWLTPTAILNAQNDYAIAPGTTHLIDRGAVEFLLNRRTTQPFGGRYVSFYDYAAPNAAAQGLMVWRRYHEVHTDWEERSLLIVADRRRYYDARDRGANPRIHEYHDMLSDPFAAGDITDPRSGNTRFNEANVSAVHSLTAGAGLRQVTLGEENLRTGVRDGTGYHPDPGNVNLALTDIRYAGDNILVDVALAPPSAAPVLTAEVQEGQVTLQWNASTDPTVSYQYQYLDAMLWISQSTTDTAVTLNLTDNTAYTFEVSAVNGLGRSSTTLTATPQALGHSEVDFVEDVTPDQDDTPAVATYTVTGLGNTPNWTLEDDTRNAFELQGMGATRELHFQQSPDFETLQDATYSVTIQARAGQVTVTQAVSVRVVNAEEAGTVVVMPTTARRVGEELTATLTDPDGDVSGASWRWHRRASDTMEWVAIQDATAATYSLMAADVGYVLQATVSYTDGHGSNKSAESAPVLGLPSAPREFEAVAGNGEVALRWQPPALDGGSPIDVYKVLYFSETQPNTDKAGFSAVLGGSSARDTTIKGLTNGTRYVFRVAAHNEVGNGDRAEAKATPQVPCQLTGEPAPTFAENATGVVGTYTASAGCGSALSWKLAGTDARFFELKGEGMSCTLEFDSSHSPPNFERPADADKNNTYAVSVSIGEVSVSVTVSVTDANDAGVIRLSTPAPRAGQSLTATLSDEDGIAEPVSWTPHYEGTSDGGGVTGQASEATQTWTLTIPNSRVGQLLRIQADYTDSFGAASALSAWTSPVRPAANRAPSVSGPASVDIAENSLAPWLLGTYTGRDPDGDELTWSVTGPDASAFELKAPASPGAEPSRALHLASAADYETQASYDVWVKVSDAALSDSLRVSVSVINQNEEGEVVLTGGLPPEVGTAVVAALTDPDGQITGASWQWQRRLGATGAWEALGSGVSGASSAVSGAASAYPELSSYTPVSGDVGWQLQATGCGRGWVRRRVLGRIRCRGGRECSRHRVRRRA